MMDGHKNSVEFEARIDDGGQIHIPDHIAKELGTDSVHVRLTVKAISSELKQRNVSEDEITRISNIQLESRDQVVKFLLSEGALQKGDGRKRAQH